MLKTQHPFSHPPQLPSSEDHGYTPRVTDAASSLAPLLPGQLLCHSKAGSAPHPQTEGRAPSVPQAS